MSHICSFELFKLFPDDLLAKDTVKVEVPAPALWHLKFNKKKFPLSKAGPHTGEQWSRRLQEALPKQQYETRVFRKTAYFFSALSGIKPDGPERMLYVYIVAPGITGRGSGAVYIRKQIIGFPILYFVLSCVQS